MWILSSHLDVLQRGLVAWPEKAEAPLLPHLALAVVVVDPNGDADSTGPRAWAPGSGLHQAVLLPG